MSEHENKNAPLLHVKNLRVSFKDEDKQYIETVKGRLALTFQQIPQLL